MRTGTYLEDLAAAGIKPGDLDLVVCGHLRLDHVLAVHVPVPGRIVAAGGRPRVRPLAA